MGGILILKSSDHWGRGKSIWGDSDNGKQRGGGVHNSVQNNYHTRTFFFSRKNNFHGHFQRKNSFHFYIISFKRTYVNCSLANFEQNIWQKLKKYSKIGQHFKNVISNFAYFLTAYCQSLVSGRKTGH